LGRQPENPLASVEIPVRALRGAADTYLQTLNCKFGLAVRPVRRNYREETNAVFSVDDLERAFGRNDIVGARVVCARAPSETPPKPKGKQRFLNVRVLPTGVTGMMIADQFDHRSDAGFVRAYTRRRQRRQFQISIVLVLVLALAAVALGMLARLDRRPITTGRSSAVTASSPHVAEILLDIRG
jgi:hypothetical protein